MVIRLDLIIQETPLQVNVLGIVLDRQLNTHIYHMSLPSHTRMLHWCHTEVSY